MREPNGRKLADLYMERNRKTSTMPTNPRCAICKSSHPTPEHGLTHGVCKAVPVGFVYVDQAYPSGPRGALLELKANAR